MVNEPVERTVSSEAFVGWAVTPWMDRLSVRL
jgi:hypothetical protein